MSDAVTAHEVHNAGALVGSAPASMLNRTSERS